MLRAVLGLAMMVASPVIAEGTCAFGAYTGSDDLANISIHAGPSAASDVLGMAPIEPPGSDYAEFGTDFRVMAMQDGWAKVTDVTSMDSGARGPEGWIDGRHIVFSAQTDLAFAAPDAGSDVVWSSDRVWPFAKALLDCDGEWALVTFDDQPFVGNDLVTKGEITAWVRGVCSSQMTTCDGTFGDRFR